jgi:CubicO group peptidase (beta-lactamase class C family)
MHRREALRIGAALLTIPFARRLRAAPSWEQEFGEFVQQGLAQTGTPGLSVAIVRAGEVRFSAGYGLANVKDKVPVTPDTAFHIASVSKVVTGTALLQLQEQQRYQLDEPISRYLDFEVVHPQFPAVPITFRHLFTHTSGISDAVYGRTKAFAVAGDPTLPLRDFLTGYLSPGGRWYAADKCFLAAQPGTQWQYSNVAIALLGYLAGRVGPDPLEKLTQQQLFGPLGMRNTSWKLSALPAAGVARPYKIVAGRARELPPTGYPDWPAGLLRTSARDFAQFLAMLTNQGKLAGHQYLRPDTLQAFLAPQPIVVSADNPSIKQALIWQLRELPGGGQVASHSGGDPGADTVACLQPDQGIGVLVFANASGNPAFRAFQKEVVLRLLKQAAV